MTKIVSDNLIYTKVVKAVGMRNKAVDTDLSGILPEDIEKDVKDASEISMGTEISETDEKYIWALCDQILEMTDYRASLQEYLKNRMQALAPNLTAVVGELVGARLICHAGSLVNLAKCPASTIQILGAEKALFNAIKTSHNTIMVSFIKRNWSTQRHQRTRVRSQELLPPSARSAPDAMLSENLNRLKSVNQPKLTSRKEFNI